LDVVQVSSPLHPSQQQLLPSLLNPTLQLQIRRKQVHHNKQYSSKCNPK
jgi:hypothetical protein